jgi:ADP-dependent NAD(P)H-hydrate dehydratase / NAD(P)H-hydrate epimerase
MREIDRLTVENHQVTSLQLMESAATACLQTLALHLGDNLTGKKIQVLCGPGNNGGDGAALARQLASRGVETNVILFGNISDTQGDARQNFESVRSLVSRSLTFSECSDTESWRAVISNISPHEVLVDALFGTGLKRPLNGVYRDVVNDVNEISARRSSLRGPTVVSVDLPSGLDADQPQPIGPAVNADLTVTFTAPKAANVLPPAAHLNGKLVVADIGSRRALIDATEPKLFLSEEQDARDWLISTRYSPESYKKTHGEVLVVAGSTGYVGAAILCAEAALCSGAGLVTLATPASLQNAVASAVLPEVMTKPLAETDRGAVSDAANGYLHALAQKASVLAIGPGLSVADERTRRFVYAAVAERQIPTVVDADGLNCLAPWPNELRGSTELPLVLTPHIGEMRRLLGAREEVNFSDRVALARDFAIQHTLILVLKGSRTLIAAPDGRVFINPTGNAGMGTAGSGDTLTGIIAGFIAQDKATLKDQSDVLKATVAAIYIAGLGADIAARDFGMRTMIASDIREHLSDAIKMLDPLGERPRFIS